MMSCLTAIPVFSARSSQAGTANATLRAMDARGAQRQSFGTTTTTAPTAATTSSTPSTNSRLPRSSALVLGDEEPHRGGDAAPA